MKLLMWLFLLPFLMGASCQVVKDQADAPADLNHARVLVFSATDTEVGIGGTIDPNDTFNVRSYDKGSVRITGQDDCGFITSNATKSFGQVPFKVSGLPDKEFCLYNISVWTNGFDAPAIGQYMVRKFKDPNIKPLKTTMNKVDRLGVNWVQLRSQSPNLTVSPGAYGVWEDREVVIYPSGKSGHIIVTGCGAPLDSTPYRNVSEWRTTVDYLYRNVPGGMTKDCTFTIIANNDDTLAESATILVKLYKSGQGNDMLDAPIFSASGSSACFEFTDPYVVGIRVNGSYKRNSTKLCVSKAAGYVVEGVTSKHRIFYGEHNGSDWTRML